MEIKFIEQNLLDSKADIIAHCVNCQGKMGSGVAKAIKDKWSIVFSKYEFACLHNKTKGLDTSQMLGLIQPISIGENKYVVNLFTQNYYGYDGQRYTSYDAVDVCLRKLKDFCVSNNFSTIAMPFRMASDRGGADWDAIIALIAAAFRGTNLTIEINKFEK